MKPLPDQIRLRGRDFSMEELQVILQTVYDFFEEGRTRISKEVCKRIDWRQPNGWLKDRACRDVLRRLDKLGHIQLPASKSSSNSKQYSKWKPTKYPEVDPKPEITEVKGELELEMVKGTTKEEKWNELVDRYHYLGYKVSVGKTLKFLVKHDDDVLGAVSLAESAWAVKSRDLILEQMGWERWEVANNARFLLLPHVNVKNLASRTLSILVRNGVEEWDSYYNIRLKCIETYVDKSLFSGTSYKAANWIKVGTTKGYRKSGKKHVNSQSKKHVYLYPTAYEDRVQVKELTS